MTGQEEKIFNRYAAQDVERIRRMVPGSVVRLYAVSFSVDEFKSELRYVFENKDDADMRALSGEGWYGGNGRVTAYTFVKSREGTWGAFYAISMTDDTRATLLESAKSKLTPAERSALGMID